MSNLEVNRNIINISRTVANNSQAANGVKIQGQGQSVDFKTLLGQRLNEQQSSVIFSKHAQHRVDSRKIDVSSQMLGKLSNAIDKAQSKGVRDALILNGDTMFIVNIPSKTVVTAIQKGELKDNIFTNIDGTVIL